MAERKKYYNPMLDPHCQNKMTQKMKDAVNSGKYVQAGGPLNEPDYYHPANLTSSLCTDGKHRPALDIDLEVELVPSSTPGHYHLYFPTVELEWWQYLNLLTALAQAGIVHPDYVKASITRGQTLLRINHDKKKQESSAYEYLQSEEKF